MIKSPCYKCPKRILHCHNTCEDYAIYRSKIDSKAKDNGEATGVHMDGMLKIKRRKGQCYHNNYKRNF